MTATLVEAAAGAVSRELRIRVRERLEQEYLWLRTVDRPALLEILAAGDGDLDHVTLEQTLEILDHRIAAVHDYLGTVHDPHADHTVRLDCCVLLDRGEGPEWLLLAALPEGDTSVLACDSALGRAVLGARPGQIVDYPSPAGSRTARVLALQ